MTDFDEPLIDGFDVPDDALRPESHDALRDRVLAATRPVLRRRRWTRRAGACALAVLFATGGWVANDVAGTWTTSTPIDVPDDAPVAGPSPDVPEDPYYVEARAEDPDTADRARLFRIAGDRYLNEQGDIRRALRCYTQHLELAGTETSDPERDTWLLASLRQTH